MVKFEIANNTISNNTALIGGGIRFLGILPNSFQTAVNSTLRFLQFRPEFNNSISLNKALIYGDNVASYIGGI